MSNGRIVATNPEFRHVVLLDAITGTSDGTWVDMGPYRIAVEIHFSGATACTFVVCGDSVTASGTAPADSTHGTQIGSDVTADGHYSVAQVPRWLKVRCTTYGSGTVSVVVVSSL